MRLTGRLARWFKRPASEPVEAVVYFDGPKTKWHRARRNWKYEQHPGGLRVILPTLNEVMPLPHEDDILGRRTFKSAFHAHVWVLTRLKGLDTSKIVGEVRPL